MCLWMVKSMRKKVLSISIGHKLPSPPSPEIKIWDVNMHVPSDGMYGRVKHDFELPDFDYKPRQAQPGYPDYTVPQNRRTRGMYQDRFYDYVEMPERWQWFLWNLWDTASWKILPKGEITGNRVKSIKGELVTFQTYTPNSMMHVYCSTIERSRSHTDSRAVEDGRRDFPSDRHRGAKVWEWWTGTQGGNLVKILGSEGIYWRIEANDVLKSPPDPLEFLHKPWICHWFNEITPYPSGDGRWIVSRYPWIRKAVAHYGYPETGQPFPLMSKGGSLLIEKRFVVILKNGDKWSPYIKEK